MEQAIPLLIGFGLGCCALAGVALLYARTVARLLLALSDGWRGLCDSWQGFDAQPHARRVRPVTDEQLANRYERLPAKRKREMALDAWAAVMENGKNQTSRELVDLPDDPELFGDRKAQAAA